MNKPSKINKLTGGSSYTQLLSRARELMALDKRLHKLIPVPLNEHCSTLTVSGTTLILAADSPVWAARLRFHASGLVKQLADYPRLDIRAVRVRVKPLVRLSPPGKRHTMPALTSRGAALLIQTAQSVSDPALKTGLLRLARRHTNR
jgi:hypothetical protein